VAAWYSNLEEESLYLSVLVLGEIQKGIEGLRGRDARKANLLDLWLEQLQISFQSQILPVDIAISQEWGRLSSLHTVPVIDGLLAATATAHGLVLVTRNTRDFADLGIQLLNPFETRNLV
jgi:predicted nucleic acid-binding protein